MARCYFICVCARVCLRVCLCVCMCVRVCVRVHMYVEARGQLQVLFLRNRPPLFETEPLIDLELAGSG